MRLRLKGSGNQTGLGLNPRAGDLLELGSGKKITTCILCGAWMEERHCKVICTRCGYLMDCSDLF